MTQNITMKRHTELVDRMATTLGIDLEEVVFSGQLDPETLCDTVLRCTGCAESDACEAWLKAVQGQAQSAPLICRNGEVFAALQSGQCI